MAFFDHSGDRYYYFDAGAGVPVCIPVMMTIRATDGEPPIPVSVSHLCW
jgi:hypothetical protein